MVRSPRHSLVRQKTQRGKILDKFYISNEKSKRYLAILNLDSGNFDSVPPSGDLYDRLAF